MKHIIIKILIFLIKFLEEIMGKNYNIIIKIIFNYLYINNDNLVINFWFILYHNPCLQEGIALVVLPRTLLAIV